MAQPKSSRLVTEAALAPVLQDVTDAKGLAESVVSRADSGEFTGADGQDGSNVLTTDEMNRDLIESPESLTRAALSGVLGAGTSQGSPFRVGNIAAFGAASGSKPTTWETYDGTGKVVHPSVRFFPEGWNGYRYWAAATPYANSDAQLENPSILVSTDGYDFVEAPGVTNPLAMPPPYGGYNSDPYLTPGPDGKLYLFYRELKSAEPRERLMLFTSSNGVDWAGPEVVMESDSTIRAILSPSIWYDTVNKNWLMLGVDNMISPRPITRFTAPQATGPWTKTGEATFPAWRDGRAPWHIDVSMVGNQVVALIMDDANTQQGYGDLYLCISNDNGRTFSRAEAPVAVGRLYKSCFVPMITERGLELDTWVGDASRWGIDRTSLSDIGSPIIEHGRDLAASIVGAIANGGGDAFNRADSTTTLGKTPSGQTWLVDAGTFGIENGKAYAAVNANARAQIETGATDVEVTATLQWATKEVYVLARYADSQNYIRVGLSTYDDRVTVQVFVANAIVKTVQAYYPINSKPTIIGVRCVGDTLTVAANGRTVITEAATTLPVGTKVGMQTNTDTTRIHNIMWTTL